MADRRGKKITQLEGELMKRREEAIKLKEERVRLLSRLSAATVRAQKPIAYMLEIRRAVMGKEISEEPREDADKIMQEITYGLAHLQSELQRLSTLSTCSLATHEIVGVERSCFRCMGPADPIKEKPKSVQEIHERQERLIALCRVQKMAKGIVPDCPMFRPQQIDKEVQDDDPELAEFDANGARSGRFHADRANQANPPRGGEGGPGEHEASAADVRGAQGDGEAPGGGPGEGGPVRGEGAGAGDGGRGGDGAGAGPGVEGEAQAPRTGGDGGAEPGVAAPDGG